MAVFSTAPNRTFDDPARLLSRRRPARWTCSDMCLTQMEKHGRCRKRDQTFSSSKARSQVTSLAANHPFYSAGTTPEPRDIVPRASPSRPTSTYFSSSPTAPPNPAASAADSTATSSALAALRALSLRPPSPHSPPGSTAWAGYSNSRSVTASPGTSYSAVQPTPSYASTYHYGTGYHLATGMDRPLPSRQPGGAYARPKSIELVTPMIAR